MTLMTPNPARRDSQTGDLFDSEQIPEGIPSSEANVLPVECLRGRRWASNTVAIYDVLRQAFIRKGFPEDQAGTLAQDCIVAIGEYAGGRELYLPRAKSLRAAMRHREILSAWRGNNAQELADRFGVTRRWIEKLVQRSALHAKS